MAVLKCHKKNEHKRLSEPRQVQNTPSTANKTCPENVRLLLTGNEKLENAGSGIVSSGYILPLLRQYPPGSYIEQCTGVHSCPVKYNQQTVRARIGIVTERVTQDIPRCIV